MLKIVAVFLLISLASATIPDLLPQELKELIHELRTVCLPRNGITDADVDNYQIGDDSPKMMCYMKCMMLESKWMAPNGDIQYDHIIGTAHSDIESILVAAVNKCKSIPDGSHECEKAYNFHVCLQKADPVNYFLP